MKQTITLRKNEAKILLYLTEAKNQQNTPTIMAAELRKAGSKNILFSYKKSPY